MGRREEGRRPTNRPHLNLDVRTHDLVRAVHHHDQPPTTHHKATIIEAGEKTECETPRPAERVREGGVGREEAFDRGALQRRRGARQLGDYGGEFFYWFSHIDVS